MKLSVRGTRVVDSSEISFVPADGQDADRIRIGNSLYDISSGRVRIVDSDSESRIKELDAKVDALLKQKSDLIKQSHAKGQPIDVKTAKALSGLRSV